MALEAWLCKKMITLIRLAETWKSARMNPPKNSKVIQETKILSPISH